MTFCDLAFIRFATIDTSSNHVVSQRILAIKTLKSGYRHIRLRSPNNSPLAVSSLFIFSNIQEEGIEVIDPPLPATVSSDAANLPVASSTVVTCTSSSLSKLSTCQQSTSDPTRSKVLTAANLGTDVSSSSADTRVQSKPSVHSNVPATVSINSSATCVVPSSSQNQQQQQQQQQLLQQQQQQQQQQVQLQQVQSSFVPSSSVPTRRRMFFLVVHGVVPDEPSTILKITQESTAADVILQALIKGGRRSENAIDYALMEQVTSSWDKKHLLRHANKAYYSIQRVLEPNERPLEAQSKWKGEGRFVLKKLDDPSTRAWMSTIKAANVLKERKLARQISEGTSSNDSTCNTASAVSSSTEHNNDGNKFSSWSDDFLDNFLVCIYNVSPDQPYTILKASTHSTAQEIIQRVSENFIVFPSVKYASLVSLFSLIDKMLLFFFLFLGPPYAFIFTRPVK